MEKQLVEILDNKRYIRETGTEARIAAIIEPIANDMGFDLVRIKILPDNGCTLQIMAEDKNGNFSISDCEKLSREINPALDVHDPLDKAYHLEISSAGVDRPLVRARDFKRYIGHEAKVELFDMINGRKRFRGDIIACDDKIVTIKTRDALPETDPNFDLELKQIAEAKLLMSDKLLDMAAKAQKHDNVIDGDVEIIDDIKNNILKETK